MYGFIEQFADNVFAPEQVRLLTDAFDDAWARVQSSKAPWAADEYAKVGRAILAKHIIANAQSGEFDIRWLADSALLYLTQQKLRRTPPSDILIGLTSLVVAFSRVLNGSLWDFVQITCASTST